MAKVHEWSQQACPKDSWVKRVRFQQLSFRSPPEALCLRFNGAARLSIPRRLQNHSCLGPQALVFLDPHLSITEEWRQGEVEAV